MITAQMTRGANGNRLFVVDCDLQDRTAAVAEQLHNPEPQIDKGQHRAVHDTPRRIEISGTLPMRLLAEFVRRYGVAAPGSAIAMLGNRHYAVVHLNRVKCYMNRAGNLRIYGTVFRNWRRGEKYLKKLAGVSE